ncbi:glycoside hydrolase/deacetylase [Violaceomyces palustris]|uniref:Glycoside hydrolase/deacetylase n=1 Tax=Violaceomyces palustris TaxID=1673888 RepID=A0ACD0P1K6_9BASI|nr:glycoside hydrolase/deacetylase [Violaceomyces palustris]
MHLSAKLVTVFALTAGPALANIGRGIPTDLYKRHRDSGEYQKMISKRSPSSLHHTHDSLAKRANTESQQAQITSKKAECTPYSVPEVAAILSDFPTPWENATILADDTAAQNVWKSIQDSGIIPSSVKPKGTVNGDFSGVNYNNAQDPDCWWTATNCHTPKQSDLAADVYQCPEPSTWGLTFDDGPNCSHNAFYDYLLENQQKATMFYIGSNVLDWPLEAQRGLVDGHHICVHTWSHQYMTSFPDDQVFAELYYTAKAIKDVVGVTPTCWRPPFGDVDDRVRAIATGLGLETVIWTDDTDDWQILPLGTKPASVIDSNYASIISKESSSTGNIVLTHEINGYTMKEFMKEYPAIKAAYKHVVPLTACMNRTKPYPEDITYPDFEQYTSGNVNATGLPSGDTIKASDADYTPVTTTDSAPSTASTSTSKGSSSSSSSGKAQAQSSSSSSSSSKSSSKTSGASSSSSLALTATSTAILLALVTLLLQ